MRQINLVGGIVANHRSANLALRVDKPENVYRYIYDWETVASSHDKNVMYLLIHGIVQWGSDRSFPIEVFSIAVQYSRTPGVSVDLSQPPHIPEPDVDAVNEHFARFVSRRKGRK